MKRAIVTGASGYIGGRLTAALAAAGVDVVATALPGTEGAVPRRQGVVVLPLALDNRASLAEAAAGADTCFHLAGVLPGASRHSLRSVNVDGTAHVMRAAMAAGVRRLVFLSSTAVYRPSSPYRWPLTEDAPLVEPGRLAPRGYGESKVAAEDVLRTVEGSELAITVLRASTVYGTGSRTLNTLLERLQTPRAALASVGLRPTMQWVLVDDLVGAAIATAVQPNASARILNIVGGELFSGLDLVSAVNATLGRRAPSALSRGLRFSYAAATSAIGYQPTPLHEGLQRSL